MFQEVSSFNSILHSTSIPHQNKANTMHSKADYKLFESGLLRLFWNEKERQQVDHGRWEASMKTARGNTTAMSIASGKALASTRPLNKHNGPKHSGSDKG